MKKKSLFILSFVCVVVLFFNFTITSFAQNPCKEDVAKYCSDVQPGGGRIVDCLKDHYKDLSQECYDFISKKTQESANGSAQNANGKSAGNPLANSCKPDVAKYCSDVKPGEGRIVKCLMDHYKDVSQECYDTLAKIKSRSENTATQGGQEETSENSSSEQQ